MFSSHPAVHDYPKEPVFAILITQVTMSLSPNFHVTVPVTMSSEHTITALFFDVRFQTPKLLYYINQRLYASPQQQTLDPQP